MLSIYSIHVSCVLCCCAYAIYAMLTLTYICVVSRFIWMESTIHSLKSVTVHGSTTYIHTLVILIHSSTYIILIQLRFHWNYGHDCWNDGESFPLIGENKFPLFFKWLRIRSFNLPSHDNRSCVNKMRTNGATEQIVSGNSYKSFVIWLFLATKLHANDIYGISVLHCHCLALNYRFCLFTHDARTRTHTMRL